MLLRPVHLIVLLLLTSFVVPGLDTGGHPPGHSLDSEDRGTAVASSTEDEEGPGIDPDGEP